jgi:hypothetical protein
MTAMNKELYTALLAAGSPEDKASLAASSVLESDARVSGIEARLVDRISSLDVRMTRLEWMAGLLMAGVASLIAKAFFHG